MTTHRSRPRARMLTVAAATLLVPLVLGGCSGTDTDADVAADPVGTPTSTQDDDADTDAGTDAAQPGIAHPTGADDVLLRIETGGGFAPVEYTFTRQPTLLLTGDGRLFVPPDGSTAARLIPVEVAQLDEAQVQEMLGLAADAGLLATPPDYTDTDGPQVADAPTTTVTLTTSDGTWRHEAYALGFADDSDARIVLSGFVDSALEAVADVPTTRFEATEVALFVQETDLDKDVVDWPVDDVVLADVNGCEVVPADGVAETLSGTGPVVSFAQEGGLYSVAGAEVLPGSTPCGT